MRGVINISIKQKFLDGMMWSFIDKIFTQFSYFFVTIYLARLIGPESFGLIGMLTIFVLLSDSVVNNGFSQALVQRSETLTEIDSCTIFYVNIIWGSLIYVILYYLAPFIAQFYNEPDLIDISRLLFFVIIINSLSVVVRAKLLIQVDFKSQAKAAFLATIISSSVAIYLAMQGYSYWAYVWLLLTKAIFQTGFLWFYCRWSPKLVFSKQSFRNLFGFGSNLMLAGIVATTVNNLYVAVIGRYFSTLNVGYFTQATNLTSLLSQFITSLLQGVTYPILTSIKEEKNRLLNLYDKLISLTVLISFPVLVGFSLVSEQFVMIFLGKEWLSAVPVIQILCFARALTPINAINMNMLNVIGKSDLFLKIDILKLPITLSSLFLAIPYGIEGIAIAVLCNVVISFFINSYYPGVFFGYGVVRQLISVKNYILATMVMYFVVEAIRFESSLLELFVKVFTGGTVYILVLIFIKDHFVIEVVNYIRAKRLKV